MTSFEVHFSSNHENKQDKTLIFFAFQQKIMEDNGFNPLIHPLYDISKPGIYPANIPHKPLQQAVIVSLGDQTLAHDIIEDQGGELASWARKNKQHHINIIAPTNDSDHSLMHYFLLGLCLGNYQYGYYKTLKPLHHITSIDVMHPNPHDLAEYWEHHTKPLLDGIYFCRDLVSAPANELNPETYAETLLNLQDDGLKVTILNEDQLFEKGMNALLGVGQGSAFNSSLAIIEWHPDNYEGQPLAIVGKGVTFDSGGISLKPGKGMHDMKFDMGGSAAVAGTMKTIAQLKPSIAVIGVIALVENMPSSHAQRPSDVVTSLSGQTIEIQNTDAEGRLILADALTYVQQEFNPSSIIDLATLTGAMIVGLGHEYAGLFSNSDTLSNALQHASHASREHIWRLPLSVDYDQLIDSDIADMKNIGGPAAGAITAAQFLQRFISKDQPWAHLDIAGTAWREKAKPTTPKGATGFGVRLLTEWIINQH